MAKANSIEPPPGREAFGHWLSGFTDGEGCFFLALTTRRFERKSYVCFDARFQIALRRDDKPVLDTIQAYLGVGRIRLGLACKGRSIKEKPNAVFLVNRVGQLFNAVVPHFDRFPLRAKKARDFALWREGVEIIWRASQRPRRNRSGFATGYEPKYTPEDHTRFAALCEAIRRQRLYESADLIVTPPGPKTESMPLFDAD